MDTKGLKLSINLEMPQEPEYKPSLEERVEDALERLEYSHCIDSYRFLKRVNQCLVKCWRCGKRSEQVHKLLALVTPAMVKYGLEDYEGQDLVEPFVTNPEYTEEKDG